MKGQTAAFVIWAVVGAAFIAMGIYDMFSRKTRPFSFWANAKVFSVSDVRGYNRALGLLFCGFGAGFILIGIPLLCGQNSPLIIVSILGAMFLSIAAMVIYVLVIEKKYRK